MRTPDLETETDGFSYTFGHYATVSRTCPIYIYHSDKYLLLGIEDLFGVCSVPKVLSDLFELHLVASEET